MDSKVVNQKLWYLVKWKDFGVDHNSWEPWDMVHTPDLVSEFYHKYPGAARHIQMADFLSLQFQSILAPGWHYLEGGVDVRGHWISGPSTPDTTIQLSVYVPPHRCRLLNLDVLPLPTHPSSTQ